MGGAVAAYAAGRLLESLLAGGRPGAETSQPVPRGPAMAFAANSLQAVQAIASRKPTATIQ